jgi:hypothetical protein
MENGQEHAWNVSRDKLIREIKSTYEAIRKFRDCEMISDQNLEALSLEELARELQTQTDLLEKLVEVWDIRK